MSNIITSLDTPRTQLDASSFEGPDSFVIRSIKDISTLNILANNSNASVCSNEKVFYILIDDTINAGLETVPIDAVMYERCIKSDWIKRRMYFIDSKLIPAGIKPVSRGIKSFIKGNNDMPSASFYKVCLLDREYFDIIKMIFNGSITCDDLSRIIEGANYMLIDPNEVIKVVDSALKPLEVYAIKRYWDKLTNKPSFDSYIKNRRFKKDTPELIDDDDTATKELLSYAYTSIDDRLEDIVSYSNHNGHRNHINSTQDNDDYNSDNEDYNDDDYTVDDVNQAINVFCDEIPMFDKNIDNNDSEDDTIKKRNKYENFRARYYNPPKDADIISKATAIQLFKAAEQYCRAFQNYDLIIRMFRAFALVPELCHAALYKEVLDIYDIAFNNVYITKYEKVSADSYYNKSPIAYNIKKAGTLLKSKGIERQVNSSVFRADNFMELFTMRHDIYADLAKKRSKLLAHAFYIVYLEECFNRTATQKTSRFVYTSEAVRKWASYEDEYTNVSSNYLDTVVDSMFFPFTTGRSSHTFAPIYDDDNVKFNIHSMDYIKLRLKIASDGLLDESFPWEQCNLNLTGSMLVSAASYNPLDHSLAVQSDDIVNLNTETYTEKFKTYLDTYYADSDIDLYIDTEDACEYKASVQRFISYIRGRYQYVDVRKIENKTNFARYKITQNIPANAKSCNKMKSIDIYKNKFGNLYHYHLPIVRMAYTGNEVYMYPSCASALITGINGNYKWFKSSISAIDIIIKYVNRGFGIILNGIESLIITSRREYLKNKLLNNHNEHDKAFTNLVYTNINRSYYYRVPTDRYIKKPNGRTFHPTKLLPELLELNY